MAYRSLFSLTDGYRSCRPTAGRRRSGTYDLCLIRRTVAAPVVGSFSSKFVRRLRIGGAVPRPATVMIRERSLARTAAEGEPGVTPTPSSKTQTSTGVMAPVPAVADADPDALVLGSTPTSGAGAPDRPSRRARRLLFAPQTEVLRRGRTGCGLAFCHGRGEAGGQIRAARPGGCPRRTTSVSRSNGRRWTRPTHPAIATLVLLAEQPTGRTAGAGACRGAWTT